MLRPSCKNTLFFVLLRQQGCTHSAVSVGMVRPDRQEANRSELFIAAFGRKTRGGGHGGTLDRKIPYLRHTPRALEKRAPYTRILAVGPIPVRDKTTSSIWCACKTKASNESRYSPIASRTIACPAITSIDLVVTSIHIKKAVCLVATEGAKNPRADWTRLSVSKRRHTGAMIDRPPGCRSVR